MRAGKYQLLLTATILERGVTFERYRSSYCRLLIGSLKNLHWCRLLVETDRKESILRQRVIFVTSERTTAIKSAIRKLIEQSASVEEGLINAL